MYTSQLMMVILLICSWSSISAGSRTCRQEKNLELMRTRAQLLLVAKREARQPTEDQKREIAARHQSSTSLPETCPDLTDEKKADNEMSVVSSCPWEEEQDFDAYRYPQVIPYAKCKCQDCRGQVSRHSCQQIWHNTVVLRHNGTCVDGMYMYEPVLEPMSVGCACAPIKTVSAAGGSQRRRRSLADILRGLGEE